MDAIPQLWEPEQLATARLEAEDAGDDHLLITLRDLELAHHKLPPIIDRARRTRLWSIDALSTTWVGWDLDTGQRLLLRCLRPRWRQDPVMHRRMQRATDFVGELPGVVLPSWHPDGDWPHLRARPGGAAMIELLPAEDLVDCRWLARCLARGLMALMGLHAQARCLGSALAHSLFFDAQGQLQLVWLDAFDARGSVPDDIQRLGSAIAELDPLGSHAIGDLARSWAERPAPSAQDAWRLLQRTLATELLDARHQLLLLDRGHRRRSRTAQLACLVRQLDGSLPPPPGQHCLRVDEHGVMTIVQCSGSAIRGGTTTSPTGDALAQVYDPEQGLDPVTNRLLLRAWAQRDTGDPEQRRAIQQQLKSDDAATRQLIRWLTAMGRLRVARLLLRAGSVAPRPKDSAPTDSYQPSS